MSKKKHNINLDSKQSFIDIDKIDLSPFQVRKYFDQNKLKELGESIQREDLSAIETIEAIVEIVDVELIKDKEYASMGKNPANRVRTLLGKLDTMRRSQERESEVFGHSKALSRKFAGQVEKIF